MNQINCNKVLIYRVYSISDEHLFESLILANTVDPVYSERVGAAKSVHLRRIFTKRI
jgi:hypothetical protein